MNNELNASAVYDVHVWERVEERLVEEIISHF